MLPLNFNIKLFLLLSLAFIFSTIIGTVTHECGHYIIARHLGYSASVNYAYTYWYNDNTQPFMDSAYKNYSTEIKSNNKFPNKEKFDRIEKKEMNDSFWIILGGPLQTMLTGTMGMLLLLNERKRIWTGNHIKFNQWIIIFLSLFWLRQPANLITWMLRCLINGKMSTNGDEFDLALSLRLPAKSIAISTAIVGFAVLIFIIFKIIPADKRITFISAGLFGGIFGFFFWLIWMGPVLMP